MLEQLVKDWKAQAEFGQGTRSYVFAVCASELEKALKEEDMPPTAKSQTTSSETNDTTITRAMLKYLG